MHFFEAKFNDEGQSLEVAKTMVRELATLRALDQDRGIHRCQLELREIRKVHGTSRSHLQAKHAILGVIFEAGGAHAK